MSNSVLKELLRMTVIIEYSEVVETIKKLKDTFPDLTGYINSKDSGYRGVHLNLKVEGLPCGIWLAPKIVVMEVDYLYTLHEKWRDFDYYEELIKLEKKKSILMNDTGNEYEKDKFLKLIEQEKLALQNKQKEEREDLELRKKTYGEIFDIAGLSDYQNDIINELFAEKKKVCHL